MYVLLSSHSTLRLRLLLNDALYRERERERERGGGRDGEREGEREGGRE